MHRYSERDGSWYGPCIRQQSFTKDLPTYLPTYCLLSFSILNPSSLYLTSKILNRSTPLVVKYIMSLLSDLLSKYKKISPFTCLVRCVNCLTCIQRYEPGQTGVEDPETSLGSHTDTLPTGFYLRWYSTWVPRSPSWVKDSSQVVILLRSDPVRVSKDDTHLSEIYFFSTFLSLYVLENPFFVTLKTFLYGTDWEGFLKNSPLTSPMLHNTGPQEV